LKSQIKITNSLTVGGKRRIGWAKVCSESEVDFEEMYVHTGFVGDPAGIDGNRATYLRGKNPKLNDRHG
jgi:hypothetical protein